MDFVGQRCTHWKSLTARLPCGSEQFPRGGPRRAYALRPRSCAWRRTCPHCEARYDGRVKSTALERSGCRSREANPLTSSWATVIGQPGCQLAAANAAAVCFASYSHTECICGTSSGIRWLTLTVSWARLPDMHLAGTFPTAPDDDIRVSMEHQPTHASCAMFCSWRVSADLATRMLDLDLNTT